MRTTMVSIEKMRHLWERMGMMGICTTIELGLQGRNVLLLVRIGLVAAILAPAIRGVCVLSRDTPTALDQYRDKRANIETPPQLKSAVSNYLT